MHCRQNTNIPVPKIHLYDLNPNNEVGARLVVMDCVNGTTTNELQEPRNRTQS